MRFFPRSAEPVEPLDAVDSAQDELPLSPQNVRGTTERSRSRIRKKEPPETYVPTGSPPRREDLIGPSPMLPPLNPTEPLSFDDDYFQLSPLTSNPPTGNGRMSPFPNMQAQPNFPPRSTSANNLRLQPNARAYPARQLQRGPPSAASSSAVQPHQFYPDSKPSIESFEYKMRDYYDASTQPLAVSQQTSASAVRDHGLRKGSPMIAIHETSSDPTLVQSRRPLKSAMKKAPQEMARKKEGEWKGKKLDLGSLFGPHQKPASSGNFSPSAAPRPEQNFDFFSEETVQVKLQRPQPHARFETQKSFGGMSNSSDNTMREKIFEKDIYDNTKMHVRRPPKGIKNWFDGFDVSSDEEEKMYMREKEKVLKAPSPVELPATEAMQTNGPLPSTFSPYDGVFEHQQTKCRPQRPAHTRKASVDPVEDNLLAIEHAKEMMKRRAQGKQRPAPSRSPASATSTVNSKHRGEAESRLAHSRLASQSVLSLSSESGGEDTTRDDLSRSNSNGDESVVLGNAASVGMHRPHAPPRQLQTISINQPPQPQPQPQPQPRETLRRSISTGKTSGSIPMRLGSDIVPVPPIPADRSTLGSPRVTDAAAQALRRLNGIRDSNSQPARSVRTTRSGADDSRSMAERSLAEETTSSATDGSRMMQVSEEEMILLELMRQKRAAMQKNSFSEGYRLALKQEQEHLSQRREGAHRTALQLLKAKEEMMKRQSATSTVFSEDHENPALAAMRRKYSALHKEDVDKALKLERFLSLDGHGQAQVVPGADRFPAPPIVVDDEAQEEEQEDQLEAPMLLQARTYSPMQKLTEKVRDGSSKAPKSAHSASLSKSTDLTVPDAFSDDYVEDHHDRVRAFLASSSASEAQELFPTPPSNSRTSTRASPRNDDWHRKRGSMLMSPSPVLEEEPILDDTDYEASLHSHSRDKRYAKPLQPILDDDDAEYVEPPRARDSRYPEPLQPRTYKAGSHKKSTQPTARERRNQYRLSYTPDSDPLLETIGGLAPPQQSTPGHKLRDPYPELTPTLEAGPLELPNVGSPDSPSLSSRPSPITPNFPQVPSHSHSSDKTSVTNFVEIAGSAASDNASYHGGSGGGPYTPDTEFSAPVHVHAAAAAATAAPASVVKKSIRRAGPPPAIDALASKRGIDRSSTGMSSITSAGEDVLAAWAELGGGSSDFNFRKVGARR